MRQKVELYWSQIVEENTKEVDKEPTKKAATFIASAAAETEAKTGTPILARRAAKTSTTDKDPAETKGDDGAKKKIRRNSKGFEVFLDYFSEDEADSSVDQSSKLSSKSVVDDDGQAKENGQNVVPEKKKPESKEVGKLLIKMHTFKCMPF